MDIYILAEQTRIERGLEFLDQGGLFMDVLVICSIFMLATVIYKIITLRRSTIIPMGLERAMVHYAESANPEHAEQVSNELGKGGNALSHLCMVALKNKRRSNDELQEVVQATAREEIVRMHAGIPVLEVMITICPLLGLLGTASGLVLVFAEVGDDADYSAMAVGIAQALSTTIAGIAVAVPAVIAHSFFCRKVETMAARLEVLLGQFVACMGGSDESKDAA